MLFLWCWRKLRFYSSNVNGWSMRALNGSIKSAVCSYLILFKLFNAWNILLILLFNAGFGETIKIQTFSKSINIRNFRMRENYCTAALKFIPNSKTSDVPLYNLYNQKYVIQFYLALFASLCVSLYTLPNLCCAQAKNQTQAEHPRQFKFIA